MNVVMDDVVGREARHVLQTYRRQPVTFVVVFSLLKSRGRTKRDVPVDGLAQMRPKAVGVRQGIHQRVDEGAFRRHQFGVLTPARIDSKRGSSKRVGNVVRVQTGCVDDRSRSNPFCRCHQFDGVAGGLAPDERRTR